MPPENKIHIVTGPVHTGKSTALLEWASRQPNVAGIVSPDREGKRMLLNIKDGEEWMLDADPRETETIAVGKYLFSQRSFEKARQILTKLCDSKPAVIILDEIGKLELQGKGLEPALGKVIDEFRNSDTRLLLVVRDELLEAALEKYRLHGAMIYRHESAENISGKKFELLNILNPV